MTWWRQLIPDSKQHLSGVQAWLMHPKNCWSLLAGLEADPRYVHMSLCFYGGVFQENAQAVSKARVSDQTEEARAEAWF